MRFGLSHVDQDMFSLWIGYEAKVHMSFSPLLRERERTNLPSPNLMMMIDTARILISRSIVVENPTLSYWVKERKIQEVSS